MLAKKPMTCSKLEVHPALPARPQSSFFWHLFHKMTVLLRTPIALQYVPAGKALTTTHAAPWAVPKEMKQDLGLKAMERRALQRPPRIYRSPKERAVGAVLPYRCWFHSVLVGLMNGEIQNLKGVFHPLSH